jgi:hypothetical protein
MLVHDGLRVVTLLDFYDNGDGAAILADIARQGGGLLEVCVLDATIEDWAHVVSDLTRLGFDLEITREGLSQELVINETLFTEGEESEWLMKLRLGRQCWTTGFYSKSMIDFQGDPECVTSLQDLEDLLTLMRSLFSSVGKRVILIPETVHPTRVLPYVTVDR